MEADTAKMVLVKAMEASRALSDLVPILKDVCPDADYLPIRGSLASIIGSIGLDLIDPILEAHPGLRAEMDQRIAKYGVYF